MNTQKLIGGSMENIVVHTVLSVGIGVGIFFTPRQRWIALHGNKKQRKKWMNAYKRKCIRWGRRATRWLSWPSLSSEFKPVEIKGDTNG